MSLRHWVAGLGIAIFLTGPIACFVAWLSGYASHTAVGFAMVFLAMGVLILMSAAWLIEEQEDEDEARDT